MKNVERRIGITFLGLRLLVAPQVRKQTPILHSTFIILNLNQFFYLLTKQLSKVISPAKQRFMWAVTTHDPRGEYVIVVEGMDHCGAQ